MSSAWVEVDEALFAKQGYKLAIEPGGAPTEFLAGEAPSLDADILVRAGEPSFVVLSTAPLLSTADVPDELGEALTRAAARIAEDAGLYGIEWVSGPMVRQGGLVLDLDTDGRGFTEQTITRMAETIVDELQPLDLALRLGVPSHEDFGQGEPWTSAAERPE